MSLRPFPPSALPPDQAQGLRQMFGQAVEHRFVPLVHNPRVRDGGVVMERLCAAFAERSLNTLVVDATDHASAPHELASVDLGACVEPLSARVSFLAARGLPMHYLDARATQTAFLLALTEAAPQADVVLLHASASDLRRMFVGRTPRPLLLVGGRPDSLTDAYASMKLLSQRLGALTYDVVVSADVSPRRALAIGQRLAECADLFLGAAVGVTAVVDPLQPAGAPLDDDLLQLAEAQLRRGTRGPAEAALPPGGAGFGVGAAAGVVGGRVGGRPSPGDALALTAPIAPIPHMPPAPLAASLAGRSAPAAAGALRTARAGALRQAASASARAALRERMN